MRTEAELPPPHNTEGLPLCVGYYFKNSFLQRSSAEYFKDCLQKIVNNIDGQFLDGWG